MRYFGCLKNECSSEN